MSLDVLYQPGTSPKAHTDNPLPTLPQAHVSAHTGSAQVHTHTPPLMYSCTYTVMLAYSFIHTHLFTPSYTHLLLHTIYTVMPTLTFTRVHMPHQTIPFLCLHTHAHPHSLQAGAEQHPFPRPRCSPPGKPALPAGSPGRSACACTENPRSRGSGTVSGAHSVPFPFRAHQTPWWAHPYTLSQLQAKSAGGNFPAFLSPDIEGVCAS